MDPWYATQMISDALLHKIAETLDLEERWHAFVKSTEATERKFKPKLQTLLGAQERSVLSKMRGKPVPRLSKAYAGAVELEGAERVVVGGDPEVIQAILAEGSSPSARSVKAPTEEAEAAAATYVNGILSPAAWQVRFENVARPFVTEAFKEAGTAVFLDIGVEAAFNVTNPTAKKILEARVFKFAQEVNETTQARLRTQLAHGFDAGESIPQLSKRVAHVFDVAKGSRTDTIARTEIVGASNRGTFQGYIDSEIVETKIWIDSRDAKVRTSPHNHRIDGQERRLKARFSNGLLHPHDSGGAAGNVVNCRCTTTAGKLKAA